MSMSMDTAAAGRTGDDPIRRGLRSVQRIHRAAEELLTPEVLAPEQRRPEQDVIDTINELERDEIDHLVDAQLRQERSGYDHNINQDQCPHCRGEWHGLPDSGCPGATATEEEVKQWRECSGAPLCSVLLPQEIRAWGWLGNPHRSPRQHPSVSNAPRVPQHPTELRWNAVVTAAGPEPWAGELLRLQPVRSGVFGLSCYARTDTATNIIQLTAALTVGGWRDVQSFGLTLEALTAIPPDTDLKRFRFTPTGGFNEVCVDVSLRQGGRIEAAVMAPGRIATMSFAGAL